MTSKPSIPCTFLLLLVLLLPQVSSATIPNLDSGSSVPAAPVADLEKRQSTGSAFGDLCFTQVNYMRTKAHVSLINWDENSAVLAKTLAQKCNGSPQQGETVGLAISGPSGYIPTWDATSQTLDAWSKEPHTSSNYARITAKDVKSFGCGWNDNICPGNKWYMHCFFGNWNTFGAPPKVEQRQFDEHSISTRQSGDLGLNMDAFSLSLLLPINNMRNATGLPDVKWSHSLVASTHDRGARCDDLSDQSIGQIVQNDQWPTSLGPNPNFYLWSAGVGWNKTKPAHGLYDPTSHEIDQFKITQPQWTSVGCTWSRNCTAADYYILYCEFSDAAPTRRDVEEDLAVHHLNATDLQHIMGYIFGAIRQEAGIQPHELDFDNALATQAQADADRCNSTKGDALHPRVIYRYDEARGNATEGRMLATAIDNWWDQKMAPNGTSRPDYDAIVQQAISKFGCAWSTKCASIHYLFCDFAR